MGLSKRLSLAILAAIALVLGGVVVFDVVADWLVEGKPLWSTVAENSLPLALVAGLLYADWQLAQSDRGEAFVSSVTTWTTLGTVTMLVISSWVVGLQVFQGELKPRIIVTQTTVVGAVAGLLVGRNTAELERRQERVQRERNRFESLFDNAPSAIADFRLVGDELVVTATNDAFETYFGDGNGRTLFDVLPDDVETKRAVRDGVDDGEAYRTETSLDTDAGRKYFAFKLVPYSVEGEGDQRGYAIFQDVTDIKETERELERTVAQLEKSNEQLQQFAYVASHDLQEPLRMVSSYVDLLASEYGDELDEEADEYIEYAVDGAERMQDMIDDLLAYSRVRTEAGEFTETDANAVLDDVRQDLELLVEEADATIEAEDLPTVTADENQLGQLFQNLIKNAIEHGGSDDEPPEVRIGAERRDDEVAFSVADNGPGIPEDQQERIFEIFEQSERDSEGTGIGLAVCQRIVNRHGGDIWVESPEGEGATFYFTIPRDTPQEPQGLEHQL